ncbi:hypothetical protein HK104_005046 [Borealophlyctis nickersoniae]|nr:hypothetical protein HK104_005046 [Borealophlyctis nickersoniae]
MSTTYIPVCLLGIEKHPSGLGVGLLNEILETRSLLRKDKHAVLTVLSVTDSVGSLSPVERFAPQQVLKEGGGLTDGAIERIVQLKKGGQHLDREDGYPNDFTLLARIVAQSAQPGMVVVDMTSKADEEKALVALEKAADLGCSVVLPFPRPEAFK